MKRNIFITGASSEIGISTCETFLKNKDTLIMNVRSKKNKNKLIKYFKNKYEYNREYFIYVFDIGDIKTYEEVNSYLNNHEWFMEKLKKRWGITSNIQLILILIVFAVKLMAVPAAPDVPPRISHDKNPRDDGNRRSHG